VREIRDRLDGKASLQLRIIASGVAGRLSSSSQRSVGSGNGYVFALHGSDELAVNQFAHKLNPSLDPDCAFTEF
jgi:hypothetical protein